MVDNLESGQLGSPRYFVGRTPDNDIVLTDETVSTRHCCIAIKSNGRIELTDLGSKNGTFVFQNGDGRRVHSIELEATDRIRIGRIETTVASLLLQVQDPANRGATEKRHIFISYRRADTEHLAGRLFDALSAVYGEQNIFFDTHTIPGAVAFEVKIREALNTSAVVIAVIGPKWFSSSRIIRLASWFRPARNADLVSVELRSALSLALPIIPILVGDTPMPKASHLPRVIRALVKINALRVRAGRDFHEDTKAVVSAIDQFRTRELSNKAANN